MNIKYLNIESVKLEFYKKFPNSNVQLLELLPNRKIKVQNKYGVCICNIDTILYYGSTTIKSAENKTEYFISLAKEIHENKFDYSLVNYIKALNKIQIICKKHGIFEQLPFNHLDNGNCPKCGKESFIKNKTKSEKVYIQQINKLHKSNYTIKEGSYIKGNIKIPHFCNKQQEWSDLRPSHVLEKQGCRKCANLLISDRNKNTSVGWKYSKWEECGLKSKHFDSFKVYIIECKNEETNELFFKIGKTFQNINKRFQSKRELPYEWKIIKIIEGTAFEISKLESKMKNENKENKYLPKIKFNGQYECFTKLKYYA